MISIKSILSDVLDPAQRDLMARISPEDVMDAAVGLSGLRVRLQAWGEEGGEIGTAETLLARWEELHGRDIAGENTIAPELTRIRLAIGNRMLEALADEQREGVASGNLMAAASINRERDLNMALLELVEFFYGLIRADGQADLSPRVIHEKNSELARRLLELIRDEDGVPDWSRVQDRLPMTLRTRFKVQKNSKHLEKEVLDAITRQEYRHVAAAMGPEALAEYLVAELGLHASEFSRLTHIIAPALGRCSSGVFRDIEFSDLPESLLAMPNLRDLVFVQMRNFFYRELIRACGEYADTETYSAILPEICTTAEKKIIGGASASPLHFRLLNDLNHYWHEVLSIEVPERIEPEIELKRWRGQTAEDGVRTAPFPSLRQRMAMKEMRDDRRKLISFFMGKGKTGAAFLAKEHVGAKKMLYICPPHLVDQTADRVGKYYKEGQRPTVGKIEAGITLAGVNAALEAEVVILPYSMFMAQRDLPKEERKKFKGGAECESVVNRVKQIPFDFVTVDEAHWARKPGQQYTERVFDFVNEIPGLYENGFVALLSGDPVPNLPDDIVAQLRIWDRDLYGDVRTLRRALEKENVDPLVLRNAVLKFMLMPDPPEDWERLMKTRTFDMGDAEREIYETIRADESLEPSPKLRQLLLSTLIPSLFTPVESPAPSSLMDECVAQIRAYFKDHACVLLGENHYKQGITQRFKTGDLAALPCFREKLEEAFAGENVVIRVIDGDTSKKRRNHIIEESKSLPEGQHMILLVMTPCIREGMDLSHIHRGICLEPDFNRSNMAQLLKRLHREGNEDVEFTTLCANDSIAQAILEHSLHKAALCNRFKEGGTLTEREAREAGQFYADPITHEADFRFGSHITDHQSTDLQKLRRIFAFLHNKGVDECRELFEVMGEEMARLYMNEWERSYSGNNARFVGGLVEHFEQEGLISGPTYGDIASGHLVLNRTLGGRPTHNGKARHILSFDLNRYLLEAGAESIRTERGEGETPHYAVCSMTDMRAQCKDASLDFANLALGLQYTKLNTRRVLNKHLDERVKALTEAHRVLKDGALLLITLPLNVCRPNQFEALCGEMKHFGFEVISEYTGEGQSTDVAPGNPDRVFENYTLVCRKVGEPHIEEVNLDHLVLSRVQRVRPKLPGRGEPKSPEPGGAIHTRFKIGELAMTYERGVDSALQEDRRYQARVEDARRYILDAASRHHGSLQTVRDTEAEGLSVRGIQLMPVLENADSGKVRWSFRLDGDRQELHPVLVEESGDMPEPTLKAE